jgi:hypothetical protein
MVPQNPEDVILLLLLLYIDPSTPNDVRRDISLVVEDIVVSITSHPNDGQRMKVNLFQNTRRHILIILFS